MTSKGDTYLEDCLELPGGEEAVLGLGHLQLARGQRQPPHLQLQIPQHLRLEGKNLIIFILLTTTFIPYFVLQSGHNGSLGAAVDTPSVQGLDDWSLRGEAERVPLDDELHQLGRQEQPVIALQQRLRVPVDGLETGEGELLEQLPHLVVVVVAGASGGVIPTPGPGERPPAGAERRGGGDCGDDVQHVGHADLVSRNHDFVTVSIL